MGEKEQTNKHGLGPSARKGSLCNAFRAVFRGFVDYIAGVYFARNFYKATRNANSSSASFCRPSFTGLLPQADWSLLFCSVNRLSLSSLGPYFPSPTFGHALKPFVWVLRQNKEIVWVAPTQTETNCYALSHKIIRLFHTTNTKINQYSVQENLLKNITSIKIMKWHKCWYEDMANEKNVQKFWKNELYTVKYIYHDEVLKLSL